MMGASTRPTGQAAPNGLLADDRPLVARFPNSIWLAWRAGLPEAARAWTSARPEAQVDARATARSLARPRIGPSTIAALTRIITRFSFFLAVALARATAARVRGRPATSGAVHAARSLVRAGGPAYVKAGQFIATAQGVLPASWTDAFAWCRDEAGALPDGVPEQRIEHAFGVQADDLFEWFDPVPLAAASIAQAHRARLDDGTAVVVKVRRPGLRRKFTDDIRAMALICYLVDRLWPRARVANAPGLVELFADVVFEEIDFRFEALNMVDCGLAVEAAGLDGRCRVPRPIPELVTAEVLVMEELPGVRYTEAAARMPDLDGHDLVRFAMSSVMEQALMFGVFHGDLHAGNVLLDDDGTLSLVDFGIIGRVTAKERSALIRMLLAFTRGNTRAQVEAIAEFEALPPGLDLAQVARELEAASTDLIEMADRNLDELDFEAMIAQLLGVIRLMASHRFRAPNELVLFAKNLLYLNGLAQTVAPDVNIMAEIQAMMLHFVQKYPAEMSQLAMEILLAEAGDRASQP